MGSCRAWLLGILAPLALGCGGSVSSDSAHSGGSGGAPPSSGGSGGSSSGGAPNPTSCDAAASLVAAKFQNFACTTTLRLDPDNGYAIGGYSISCGTLVSGVDEATARATALADTGFGSECGSQILSTSGPPDEIVIFHPAAFTKCACCGNGWVAAVSATTGLSAVGVGLPLSGTANVTFPKSWDNTSDLGSGCNVPLPNAPMHGWDAGNPYASTGATELDAGSVSSALSAVYATALPLAIQKAGQYVSSAVVLRYPRQFSKDLVQNEVIVLLNSERPLD